MIASGGKNWFTAAELADLALPGLPKTKRKVNERADDENWKAKVDAMGMPLARNRKGRGGGVEYHVSNLPAGAQAELVQRGYVFVSPQTNKSGLPAAANDSSSSQLWMWYDGQSDKIKAEAERRAMILVDIDAYRAAGMTASMAVNEAARVAGVASSTIWKWLEHVKGVPASDRLPHLAPRRKGGGKEAEVDPDVWQELLSDYLRLSQPSWMSCYRRVEKLAAKLGFAMPHAKTLWRKFQAEVPPQVDTLRRKGVDALRQMLPPQIRSVADLHAMELVNIDGHRADVFVAWPNGEVDRPTIIVIQDVYSRKILAWRVAISEDMGTARLVFADLFRKYGIPKGLLSDNGRAFASKWLTGGSKTRYRFKIRDEEPLGVLIALGIHVHWATPFRGQSKPIERAFRDLCEDVAKDPAFEGAYTGKNPMAKPDNYRSRAVPLETFCRILDAGIEDHNARLGRRTEFGVGQHSFNDVFEESYRRSVIREATEEQLRLALYAADQVTVDRRTATVRLGGNLYWSEEMAQLAGEKVVVRFDPEDLTQPVHVYNRAGQYLTSAPLHAATGFLDMGAAKDRRRLEQRHKRQTRDAEATLRLLDAAELAARQDTRRAEPEEPSIRPAATRMVRHRGQTAAALKVVSEAPEAASPNTDFDRLHRAATLRLINNEE